ncbi:MAG: hypothetical protein ACE5FU_14400 [Nitrospinota bacterium]
MYSEKEYIRKLKKLEEKNARLLEKYSAVRTDEKYLKKRVRELTKSRDLWKRKSRDKSLKTKQLAAKLKRREKAKRHQYALWIVTVCINLRAQCGCSYRSIRKILLIFASSFQLDISRIPCANTIQNWNSKMGLHALENVDNQLVGQEVSLIVDESIRLGKEKLLLILLSPLNKVSKEALCSQDVVIGFMGGRAGWPGVDIAQIIKEKLIAKNYHVKVLVSDEGSNLRKAARELGVAHLADISHAIATCLRKTFEQNPDYKSFIKLLKHYRAKGVNQDLSYLCPPKQRTKARFMNQKCLVRWAMTLLEKIDTLNETEAAFFSELKAHEPIIKCLEKALEWAQHISLPLKTTGLSKATIKKALQQLEDCSTQDELLIQFKAFFKAYLVDYELFVKDREGHYNVSSEIIESMFGVYKEKISENPLAGITLVSLELPLHCMTEKDIKQETKEALEGIFTTDLKNWVASHAADNQLVKRLKFFKKRT